MKLRPLAPVLLLACLLGLLALGAKPTPFPAPSSAKSLFKDQSMGIMPPPTPTPARVAQAFTEEDEWKIPQSWYYGAIAGAVLIGGLLLYGAFRAWRASNLFDRQYTFPRSERAALRLGATRSGGNMATIDLHAPTIER